MRTPRKLKKKIKNDRKLSDQIRSMQNVSFCDPIRIKQTINQEQ